MKWQSTSLSFLLFFGRQIQLVGFHVPSHQSLRQPLTTSSAGYPPSDSVVRDFLISPGAFQRALAFLHALFNEVASVAKHTEAPLKGLAPLDRIKPFAQQFRAYMNHGMTMGGHGEFHTQFYEKVINNAYKVCITSIGYLTILTQVR